MAYLSFVLAALWFYLYGEIFCNVAEHTLNFRYEHLFLRNSNKTTKGLRTPPGYSLPPRRSLPLLIFEAKKKAPLRGLFS
jgi:hypothetical protein